MIGLYFYEIWFQGTFQSFRPQVLLATFRTYPKDFFRKPLSLRLYGSLQIDKIWTLSKIFLKIATTNLSNHKVEHIFSLHKNFLMNASQLHVTNYLSEIKLADPTLEHFLWICFCLWWNCNYFESTHFGFCQIYITYI